MKRFLDSLPVAVCMILACVDANALNYSVKGQVVDSLDNSAEAYATLRFARVPVDSAAAALSVSDLDGKFQQTLPKSGKYQLNISATGKHSRLVEFSVSDSIPAVDLGKILLQSGVELDEVSVVAQKPLVKNEIDKVTYDTESDPESQSKTVIEMLRKVPLVTVDGQDNIKVKGSSSFKVYVNGKPNTMMSNNPKEVLRSLPATAVKSIEIITDPGAKYDAEGVGGIINIITQGARMEGYTLSVGTNFHNSGFDPYVYGSMQAGKFVVSGNYTYDYSKRRNESISDSKRVDYDDDGNDWRSLDTHSVTKQNKWQSHYAELSASYEPDTLNLLTLTADFWQGRSKTKEVGTYAMTDVAGAPIYSYGSLGNNSSTYLSTTLSFDYQHSFHKKGEMLTVSYKFDNSPNRSNYSNDYVDKVSVPFELNNLLQNNKTYSGEHTVQVDYANPFSEKHYMDCGMKFIGRQNRSDSRKMTLQDSEYVADDDQTVKYSNLQNILAAYLDYKLKVGKLTTLAGVRYEHTFVNVDYKLHPERNFSTGYDDVVPNIAVSWALTPMSSIMASYNLRISRPDIDLLNPFRQSTTPNEVSYGNPDLDSEHIHGVALKYNLFTSKITLNAELSHRFYNNGMDTYTFVSDGVLNTTSGNVVRGRYTSLFAWFNWNISAKTSVSVSANGAYADYRSEKLPERNHGFSGNFSINYNQELPWQLKLMVYDYYGTPSVKFQGKNSPYNYYGLALSRSFLKGDRLSVSLYATDFFTKYKHNHSNSSTSSYRLASDWQFKSMRYGLTFALRFGDMKTSVKSVERSIENDDVKSSSKKQQ